MIEIAQISAFVLGSSLLITICAWLGRGYFGSPGKHGGGTEGSLLVQQLVDQAEHEPPWATITGDLADEIADLETTTQLYLPDFNRASTPSDRAPGLDTLGRNPVGLYRL